MKDTVITAKRKKRELITLAVCFILANLCNLYAIIAYRSPALELLTSIGYVVTVTIFFYLIWSAIRLIVYGITLLFRKKKTT